MWPLAVKGGIGQDGKVRMSSGKKGQAMKWIAVVVACAALALAVSASFARFGFTGTVEVDGKRWEVVFEDGSLSTWTARAIFEDYRFWAERDGKIWRHPLRAENAGEERRGKNGRYAVSGCLYMDAEYFGRLVDGVLALDEKGILKDGDRSSEERTVFAHMKNEFGWLVAFKNGQERLVVPQAVSEAYRDGLAVWRRHPGTRKALEKLLLAMGKGDPAYLPETPLDMMVLYGFGEREEAEIREQYGAWRAGEGPLGVPSREEILAQFGEYDWRTGPIFTIGEFEGHLTVGVLQVRRKKQYSYESRELPWIFMHDGKRWKMFVFKGMGGASC
jgi:hypothetical protein